LRVLLLSNWFPPVISGSSHYAKSLALALAARGLEVSVVTLDWGKQEIDSDADISFPIHRLPLIRIPKLPLFYNLELMGFAFTPANVRRLCQLIDQFRPDVLHCVNHLFDTNFLAVKAARSAGIPLVGSITTPVQHQNSLIQRFYHALDFATIGWFGVRRWDGIVSLDRTVHDYVGRVYGPQAQARSQVIPFGVRLDSAVQYDDASVARSTRPQILMLGHIHPFRNPVQLVRAMPWVLKEIPDARLVLAGRVDLREPVTAARSLGLAEDQVEFRGETPHRESVRLMKESHVFASWVTGPYPSLGTAPVEAMLCRTPVVSDVPEDLFGEGGLQDQENIFLVDSSDPLSIADALIRLLKEEALRRKIGEGGRRFVMEYLDWGRIAHQMEQFYESVLKERTLRELSKC